MAICRSLLPSKRDITLVFASCVFPIYSWSTLLFFRQLPSWLLFLTFQDIASIFAYAQVFAFLQSTIVLFILTLLSAILPARFIRDRFVAQGSIAVLLTSFWALVLELYNYGIYRSRDPNRLIAPGVFLLWLALCLTSIGVYWVLICRSKRLEKSISAFAERLTVLLYVYVPVTFLSIIVVVFRNV